AEAIHLCREAASHYPLRYLSYAHLRRLSFFFFFIAPATPEIYTLSLHDALPIYVANAADADQGVLDLQRGIIGDEQLVARLVRRSEEHTSELQSPYDLVCRLLLEKKKQSEDTQFRLILYHYITLQLRHTLRAGDD